MQTTFDDIQNILQHRNSIPQIQNIKSIKSIQSRNDIYKYMNELQKLRSITVNNVDIPIKLWTVDLHKTGSCYVKLIPILQNDTYYNIGLREFKTQLLNAGIDNKYINHFKKFHIQNTNTNWFYFCTETFQQEADRQRILQRLHKKNNNMINRFISWLHRIRRPKRKIGISG